MRFYLDKQVSYKETYSIIHVGKNDGVTLTQENKNTERDDLLSIFDQDLIKKLVPGIEEIPAGSFVEIKNPSPDLINFMLKRKVMVTLLKSFEETYNSIPYELRKHLEKAYISIEFNDLSTVFKWDDGTEDSII